MGRGTRVFAAVCAAVLLHAGAASAAYEVGAAKRSINPTSEEIESGRVFLGGYGATGAPPLGGRAATGVLAEGQSVRAFVVRAQGGGAVAMADMEVQGWFVATRDGPYGLVDMRRAVQERTNGGLRADEVFIQSDHSHAGADTMGVWGGVPLAYRKRIFERTVDAIVEAYAKRRPAARLVYGTADGSALLNNQFDYDPDNQSIDSEVRVLQARDARGDAIATLVNFSAHATVLGGGNTKVSGDWVQRFTPMVERRTGAPAVTMVGTLGRTQPADRGCPDEALEGDAKSLCTLDSYARRVAARTATALAGAKPVRGAPAVAARSYLVQDLATNAVLLGLLYAGDALAAPLNRSTEPPWITGNVLGTVTGTARIGDVLVSAVPGEIYPQIALAVREAVGDRARGFMTLGLANDQLGYIIAPFPGAFVKPICATAFEDCEDTLPVTPGALPNDNYFFNASNTIGERVVCSLLRGAEETLGVTGLRDGRSQCALFPNDAQAPPGADVGAGPPAEPAGLSPLRARSARCRRATGRRVVCRFFLSRPVSARVRARLVQGGRVRARGTKVVSGRHIRIGLRGRPGRVLRLRVGSERISVRARR